MEGICDTSNCNAPADVDMNVELPDGRQVKREYCDDCHGEIMALFVIGPTPALKVVLEGVE